MATVLSWSGGKDAAFALWELRRVGDDPVELLTTLGANDRSSMHGVRRDLYAAQAEALGVPIRFVELPEEPSNDEYEERMAAVVADYESRGVDRMAFADLFLDDVRAYREERLADADVDAVFPLWGRDTDEQARAFIDAGFRATVVAVDGDALDPSFAGRAFDADFLAALPEDVDPCGEHGAFHTFVHDGPVFEHPVPVATGDVVAREVGDTVVHYCDLRRAQD